MPNDWQNRCTLIESTLTGSLRHTNQSAVRHIEKHLHRSRCFGCCCLVPTTIRPAQYAQLCKNGKCKTVNEIMKMAQLIMKTDLNKARLSSAVI